MVLVSENFGRKRVVILAGSLDKIHSLSIYNICRHRQNVHTFCNPHFVGVNYGAGCIVNMHANDVISIAVVAQ